MDRNILLSQGWEMDDQDQLSAVISQVKDLPMVDMMARYGVKPERYRGNRVFALCPFHMDEHIGSFSINEEEKMCWCFACNQGGDLAHSMSKIWHKPYVETVLQIAADTKLISAEVFREMSGKDYSGGYLDESVKGAYAPPKKEKPNSETLDMWTKVYEFMRDWMGLDPEDEVELKENRKLSDDRIKKDYFTLNTSDPKKVSRFIFDMKSKFPEYKDRLSTVPGFFEEQKKGHWFLSMFVQVGIGILLRDCDGRVIGVQVRDRERKPDRASRYHYLSYKCPKSFKYQRGGGTVGTPIDVLYPSEETGNKIRLAIVEGRFKSEQLIKAGFITLSVQGVNNISGIEEVIAQTVARSGKEPEGIYVFYDGDQLRNGVVFGAGVRLSRYLKEKGQDKVIFVIWDPDLGKGIDDLIFAGNRDCIKCFDSAVYEDTFEKAYDAAEKESGLDLKNLAKLSKDDRSKFYDIFERETKKRFNI